MAALNYKSPTQGRNRKPSTGTTTMIGSSTKQRIRSPNPQDVIKGRGGNTNNHPGNKAFRSMVRKRKKDYNLADNKKQKTAIAIEIVRQVHEQNPPGRFLTKDPSATRGDGCHWWIKIDETDAIAKTTQALREGAPEIRRKRKNNITPTCTRTKESDDETKHSKKNETVNTPDNDNGIILPITSSISYEQENMYLPTTDDVLVTGRSQGNVEKIIQSHERHDEIEHKKVEQIRHQQIQQLNEQVQYHHPINTTAQSTIDKEFMENCANQFNPLLAETTRLMAALDPDLVHEISMKGLRVSDPSLPYNVNNKISGIDEKHINKDTETIPPTSKETTGFHRVHSLASPDYDSSTNMECIMGSSEIEFVNPFADERNAMSIKNNADVVLKNVPRTLTKKWGAAAAAENEEQNNGDTESPLSF